METLEPVAMRLLIKCLCASDDHAGTHALRLAEAVETAELIDRDIVFLSNRLQGVALDHFVVDTLAAVAAGISATDLLAAVSAIAHLAAGTCGEIRLRIVATAVEDIVVARDILIAEVEHQCRVEGYAAQTRLEMEMRACASSGVAAQTDGLAGAHLLVLADELLGEVAVDGLKAIGMTDDDIVAVAVGFVAHDAHLAGEGGTDGVADIYFDVQAFVHTAPAATEVTGDDAARRGHAEMTKVDDERVGERGGAVCVAVVPLVAVELGSGRLQVFFLCEMADLNRVQLLGAAVDRGLSCQQVLSQDGLRR